MDNSNITKERFSQMVDKSSPNSNIFTNCCKAFAIGGLICVFAQAIIQWLLRMGVEKDIASTLSSVSLIFLASLLTGIGVFDNLAKFGGAGAIVPITGFANAVAAPAVEFKKEGFIFGVGAKMFVIAGPVIVYGLATSWVIGIIYWLFNRIGG
ncbi:MAG: stage V sporulation protein AC [Defluviitaleaceae bacterium]|nr:stage V sporulation protein AC [Defluviitaleaceae bacterium]MCL2836441.1 stage V sporulation protein AC [Defluviitaleaceae bacterium]